MRNDKLNTDSYPGRRRDRRAKDFPELQVGFPERNDASSPYHDMERIHVDPRTMGISKKSAAEISREMKEPDVR